MLRSTADQPKSVVSLWEGTLIAVDTWWQKLTDYLDYHLNCKLVFIFVILLFCPYNVPMVIVNTFEMRVCSDQVKNQKKQTKHFTNE